MKLIACLVLALLCATPAHTQDDEMCRKKVNIGFVLDSSRSMSTTDYRKQKEFVKQIAATFSISPRTSRAGAIVYSDDAVITARFGQFPYIEDFSQAVDAFEYMGKRTRIDKALKVAAETLFTESAGARPENENIMIILTDGLQTPDPDAVPLVKAAKPLHDKRIRVFAIGVGHHYRWSQLRDIVLRDQDIYEAESFDVLLGLVKTIARGTCAPAPVVVPKCRYRADIGFIMDASNSIGPQDFQKQKDFVNAMAAAFTFGSRQTAAGVITYSDQASLVIPLGSHFSSKEFQNSVNSIPYTLGRTRIDKALQKANTELFSVRGGARFHELPQIMVILTDGRQTPDPDAIPLYEAVRPLQQKGVVVLAVGVGSRIDLNELRQLVQKDSDVFSASNFDDLLQKAYEISEKTCQDVKKKTSELVIFEGGWSSWQLWDTCVPSCGGGVQSRIRTCSSPPLTQGSLGCVGENRQTRACNQQPCEGKISCTAKIDLAFVMDASTSIGPYDFQKERDFVKAVADAFTFAPDQAIAGLVLYSTTANEEIPLGQHMSSAQFQLAVDQIPYIKGQTRIDKALKLTHNTLFSRSRTGFPKVMIILTDGVQTKDPDAVPLDQAVAPLHRDGVRVFAVGVGSLADRDELRLMVQRDDDVFLAKNFDDLLKKTYKIAQRTCPAVDGGWSLWEQWGRCSQTCGSGTQTRQRFCNNPVPSQGGRYCPGSSRDTRTCNQQSCSVDGNWGDWSYWGGCDRTCGRGQRTRTRECNNPAPGFGGRQCYGRRIETQACNQQNCLGSLSWSQWENWDTCVPECGGGQQTRRRVCPNRQFGTCPGQSSETRACNQQPCTKVVCSDKADLAFLMDASGSIGPDDFQKERDFVKAVAGSFTFGRDQTLAGVIRYHSFAYLDIPLGKHFTSKSFRNEVDQIPYTAGQTRIDKALQMAAREIFTAQGGSRPGFPRILIILTDGVQTQDPDAIGLDVAVRPLHQAGVHVIAVGIGSQTKENELLQMVLRDSDVYSATDFDDLLSKAHVIAQRTCEVITRPVGDIVTDGNWSGWSRWTSCSVTCGRGRQYHSRTCTNPPPSNGGSYCRGDSRESRVCNMLPCPRQPIDGNWSPWSGWASCSQTCGRGSQYHSRTCTNPPPSNGGSYCRGDPRESRLCNMLPCPRQPINGNWSPWSAWASCSQTCGRGRQYHSRTCTNPPPSNGGSYCRGDSRESRLCNMLPCPRQPINGNWSPWSGWASCSVTCGRGRQYHSRTCTNPPPSNGGSYCRGDPRESRLCNMLPCPRQPINGNWSPWSGWASCSQTCGRGRQYHSRTCTNPPPSNGGSYCRGDSRESRLCNMLPCPRQPINGNWSPWSGWASCSVTCGRGRQYHSRTCTNPPPSNGGSYCRGDSRESRLCNMLPCPRQPINGDWSPWSAWASCSVTCGRGRQYHSRTCTNPPPSNGGSYCRGDSRESRLCNMLPCPRQPINGNWSPWSGWASCSQTCGRGRQYHSRTCTNPPPSNGGSYCRGDSRESRLCNMLPCPRQPINGNWSPWSGWASCSQTCGRGRQYHSRTCTNPPPSNGGSYCRGNSQESRLCNMLPCPRQPINGNWSPWSSWASCSLTCGRGRQYHSRTCTNPPPSNGGSYCRGDSRESRLCNMLPCPRPPRIDGGWSDWGSWSRCSQTCGGGKQYHYRTCTNPPPSNGGVYCNGDSRESRDCNTFSCRIQSDGQWSNWGGWSYCPVTCGGGRQVRSRTCTNPPPSNGGYYCSGSSQDSRACSTLPCRVNVGSCPNLNAEVLFLLTSANDVGRSNFDKQLTFVKQMAISYGISQGTKIGVVTYGDDASVHVKFGEFTTLNDLSAAIHGIGYRPGLRRMDKALGVASNNFFPTNGIVPYNVPQIVILVTNGPQSKAFNTIPLSRAVLPLRNAKVKVFVLGIGSSVNYRELRVIAYSSGDIYRYASFDDLVTRQNEFARTTCSDFLPKPQPSCLGTTDLAFILDSSGSIGAANFQRQKQFVTAMASSFTIGPLATHVGVITYESFAYINFLFNEHNSLDEIRKAVSTITYTSGQSRLNTAMDRATSTLLTTNGGARHGIPKVVVVLTDGIDDNVVQLRDYFDKLRGAGIKIILIGVGSNVDSSKLRNLVGSGNSVVLLPNFNELVARADEIALKSCRGVRGPFPPSTGNSCHHNMDVAFALDSSADISHANYQKQKEFVKEIAANIGFSLQGSRMGVLAYGDAALIEINLDHHDRADFMSKMDKIPFYSQRRRIDKALETANLMYKLRQGGKSAASKVMVFIAAGRTTKTPNGKHLWQAVTPLKTQGVKIIAIGIGNDIILRNQLQILTDKRSVFMMPSYDVLLKQIRNLKTIICEAAAPKQQG